MDLLEDWYDSLLAYKWNNGLLNDPHFRNITALKDEIRAFFPDGELSLTLSDFHDNWFAHVLKDQQPNSIYLVSELAELIRFYRTLPNREVYQLFQKSGKLNYKGLQERFFEVQVNYLLTSVGIAPELGHRYQIRETKIENGIETEIEKDKEIDLLFKFEGREFNVEATKYYDAFKEELLSLGTDIIEEIGKVTVQRTLTIEEAFCGYIGFKRNDERLIRKNKQLIKQGIKDFLHGYRSAKNETIIHPGKKETDDYVFHIEPEFTGNFERKYDALLKSCAAAIKFKITADLQTSRYNILVRALASYSIADANKRLLHKISEKLKQHRHYTHQRIIVIAIEELFTSFHKGRALPIAQNQLDENAIHDLVRGRATVMLLFKRLNKNGISYQKMIFGHGLENEALYNKLRKIYLPIRYVGNY